MRYEFDIRTVVLTVSSILRVIHCYSKRITSSLRRDTCARVVSPTWSTRLRQSRSLSSILSLLGYLDTKQAASAKTLRHPTLGTCCGIIYICAHIYSCNSTKSQTGKKILSYKSPTKNKHARYSARISRLILRMTNSCQIFIPFSPFTRHISSRLFSTRNLRKPD